MTYSESAALRALKAFTDPQTGRDPVASGRLKSLDLDGARLRATLEIPRDLAPAYSQMTPGFEAALTALDGVDSAQIILTAHQAAPKVSASKVSASKRGQPHKPKRPDGHQGDAGVKQLLIISSAKGGVGKSTIAFNLACALARSGQRVGLLDADIHGPSLPLLSGLAGARAPTVEHGGRTLIQPIERHGLKLLSIGFLTRDDGPIVWRGPMVQGAISRMLWDAHWGDLDILVIDMPPGTGDPQLGLAQDFRPSYDGRQDGNTQTEKTMGALIVTTPQDLALADARKGEQMFAKVDIPVIGRVLNMSAFTCPDCGTTHDIFGTTDMPALADIPLTLELREASARGEPSMDPAFDRLAARTLEILP